MKKQRNESSLFLNKKILLLDGNLPQVLPLIKAYKNMGCETYVLCGSKLDVGYASKYSSHKILKSINYEDFEGTYQLILSLAKELEIDLLIPLIDFYAIIVSKNKNELEKYCKVYVEEYSTFLLAINKYETMKICIANGIPCPQTYLVDSVDQLPFDSLTFPLVIKPRESNGAKGFSISNNLSELYNNFNKTINRFGPVVIQDYIPQSGRQFQVEILMDKYGECKLFVLMDKVRWYPLNGGSSTLNITMHNDVIKEICIKLLKCIHWRGYASLDIIEDPRDGSFKIMEINPRMNGTCKICFASGVDLASSILEDVYDYEVIDRTCYRDGVRLRVFFKDVLWFLKSKNRFKCKPSWFSNKHTVDEFISFDDPKVGFRYFLSCFKRLKNDKKNRV